MVAIEDLLILREFEDGVPRREARVLWERKIPSLKSMIPNLGGILELRRQIFWLTFLSATQGTPLIQCRGIWSNHSIILEMRQNGDSITASVLFALRALRMGLDS